MHLHGARCQRRCFFEAVDYLIHFHGLVKCWGDRQPMIRNYDDQRVYFLYNGVARSLKTNGPGALVANRPNIFLLLSRTRLREHTTREQPFSGEKAHNHGCAPTEAISARTGSLFLSPVARPLPFLLSRPPMALPIRTHSISKRLVSCTLASQAFAGKNAKDSRYLGAAVALSCPPS